MNQWLMLTLIGKDQPGIVAQVTAALYQAGCNLGEASMLRLGGNFTIMLMVDSPLPAQQLAASLAPIEQGLSLRIHLDPISGELHHHVQPDVQVQVHGADRAGIVAQVSGALAAAGLNILALESDVGGSAERPIYIMHIEGAALRGIPALQAALEQLQASGSVLNVRLSPLDTYVL
jgi:glycine cleavage system transcriptional repressor